ncbi:MAG: LD-carboxypeptidase, partial [Desulfobacula sp.]|nr:LD-carboxypeptidase [Desulfobacula sp.]
MMKGFSPLKKGIIAVRGGFGAMRMLAYLDWELIQKNPKLFMGFSDATAFFSYRDFLLGVLRHRVLAVFTAVAALGASLLLIPYIGTEFIPPSDEGEVRITGEMELGT